MTDCHVVAYVQEDGTVTMHQTGGHPGFANTVHHAIVRASDQVTVIIWWRDRLKPHREEQENQLIADQVKKAYETR